MNKTLSGNETPIKCDPINSQFKRKMSLVQHNLVNTNFSILTNGHNTNDSKIKLPKTQTIQEQTQKSKMSDSSSSQHSEEECGCEDNLISNDEDEIKVVDSPKQQSDSDSNHSNNTIKNESNETESPQKGPGKSKRLKKLFARFQNNKITLPDDTTDRVIFDRDKWFKWYLKIEKKPYKCPMCSSTFNSQTGATLHFLWYNHYLPKFTYRGKMPPEYLPKGVVNPEMPENYIERGDKRFRKKTYTITGGTIPDENLNNTVIGTETFSTLRKRRKKKKLAFSTYQKKRMDRHKRFARKNQQYWEDYGETPCGTSAGNLPGNRLDFSGGPVTTMEIRNPNLRESTLTWAEAQRLVEINLVEMENVKKMHLKRKMEDEKFIEILDKMNVECGIPQEDDTETISNSSVKTTESFCNLERLDIYKMIDFDTSVESKATSIFSKDLADEIKNLELTDVKADSEISNLTPSCISLPCNSESERPPCKKIKLIGGEDEEIPNVQYDKVYSLENIKKMDDSEYESVEYDLDDEDSAWLKLINQKRKQNGFDQISENLVESLIDLLERVAIFESDKNKDRHNSKESNYSKSETKSSSDLPLPDEEAVCCICCNGESSDSNQILFCEMCNVAVHQECYGVHYIPEGPWLCRRCIHSPSKAVSCELCPNKTGAFKPTNVIKTGWCHISCALWIPEVTFGNTMSLEPIEDIHKVQRNRFNLKCFICKKSKVGACIQCSKAYCFKSFHVTCGQKAGLYMNMDTIHKRGAQGQTTVSMIKTAYCQMHSPEDWSPKPLKSTERMNFDDNSLKNLEDRVIAARAVINSGKEVPVTCAPYIPIGKIGKLQNRLYDIRGKGQFFQHLLSYWTQKRLSKRGAPLLRTLQQKIQKSPVRKNRRFRSSRSVGEEHDRKMSGEDVDLNVGKSLSINTSQLTSPFKKRASPKGVDMVIPQILKPKSKKQQLYEDTKNDIENIRKQLIYWRTIRADFEKVRLEIELVKKREKLKRDRIKKKEEIWQMRCFSLNTILSDVVVRLKNADLEPKIFQNPVTEEDAPFYYEIIKNPMDLSTMQTKVENFQYKTLTDLSKDFDQMIKNCFLYNDRASFVAILGSKLRDNGKKIIKSTASKIDEIGIDYTTGVIHENQGTSLIYKQSQSDCENRETKIVVYYETLSLINKDIAVNELKENVGQKCWFRNKLNTDKDFIIKKIIEKNSDDWTNLLEDDSEVKEYRLRHPSAKCSSKSKNSSESSYTDFKSDSNLKGFNPRHSNFPGISVKQKTSKEFHMALNVVWYQSGKNIRPICIYKGDSMTHPDKRQSRTRNQSDPDSEKRPKLKPNHAVFGKYFDENVNWFKADKKKFCYIFGKNKEFDNRMENLLENKFKNEVELARDYLKKLK